MENLVIEETASTPYIHFNYEKKKLIVSGESFPENAVKFYEPIIDWIKKYLALSDKTQTIVEFKIIYFNSSTSKIYLTLFSLLDTAVQEGKNIIINWKVLEDNETIIECGEEFMEDLEFVKFNIVTV